MDNKYIKFSDLSRLRGLSFACLNICSLSNKVDDVNLILSKGDLDCFCVCETWLGMSTDTDYLKTQN